MNTTSLYCHTGRQRCPSPHKCGDGCNFDCATLESTPLYTANSDSSNPGYPFTWLDETLNAWDDLTWWQAALVVVALIMVCGMVAGVLTGHSK